MPHLRPTRLAALLLLVPSALAHTQTQAHPGALGQAIQSCAHLGCTVEAPPASTETPPEWTHFGDYGQALMHQTFAYPNLFQLDDHRFGRNFHLANNPGNFVDGLGVLSRHTGGDPALGWNNQDVIGSYLFDAAPGSYSGYGSETTNTNLNLTSVLATKSISHALVSTAFKLGPGDYTQLSFYGHCWLGAINGDDEGCKNFNYSLIEGGEDGPIPMARVTSTETAGPLGTFLHTETAGKDGNHLWGAGRYAVLIRPDGQHDAPVFTLPITAVAAPDIHVRPLRFGTLTTSATLPGSALSAVWGLTAPYAVPANNDVPQPVTTTLQLDRASPNYISGLHPGLACMWGAYRTEHVQITSVDPPAGGTQRFSMLARYTPDGTAAGSPEGPASAYIFQDRNPDRPGEQGLCQTGGRLQAYDRGFGEANQTVPLVGAIGPHTLVYSFNAKQGQRAMPVPLPLTATVTLTRTANLVTLRSSSIPPSILNDLPTTFISAASDPSFNGGPFTLSNDTAAGTAITDYTYAQPGPDVRTPISATLRAGTPGANVLKVYPMAEILGTIDPAAANTILGARLTIEPNTIRWPLGAILDSPAHFSGFLQLSSEGFRSYQPGELLAGKTIAVSGQSLSDYLGIVTIANTTPANTYRGQGGSNIGPDGLHFGGGGAFTNIISLGPSVFFNNHNFDGNALASGTAFLNFPCATGRCTNPNASFELEQGDVNGAGWLRDLNQFTGTLTEGFTHGGRDFSSSLTFNKSRGVAVHAPFALPALGASPAPLCTGEGGILTHIGCATADSAVPAVAGTHATRSTIIHPTAPIFDVTCDGPYTLTLPAAPGAWQHIDVINIGTGACTIAATSGIGNASVSPSTALASGVAGRFVFDGTVWRIE
jgi:hypothetical protein